MGAAPDPEHESAKVCSGSRVVSIRLERGSRAPNAPCRDPRRREGRRP